MKIENLYNYLCKIPSDAGKLYEAIGTEDPTIKENKDLLASSLLLRVMGVALATFSLSCVMAAGTTFMANPLSGVIPLFCAALVCAAAHDIFTIGCNFDPATGMKSKSTAWEKAEHLMQGSWIIGPAIFMGQKLLLKA